MVISPMTLQVCNRAFDKLPGIIDVVAWDISTDIEGGGEEMVWRD